jgi:hypothetical protein
MRRKRTPTLIHGKREKDRSSFLTASIVPEKPISLVCGM